MKDLVLVGSGGLARDVKWHIDLYNEINHEWNVLGWISMEKPGTVISNLSVLGDDEWLLNYDKPIAAVIAVGNGKLRKKLVDKFAHNRQIYFPNILAPTATIAPTVKMGRGCIVTSQCVISVDVSLSDFVICNSGCKIGHDCNFSNYVTMFPGANIAGNVNLRECVSIGTGASIIQGITIGDNSFIGAGATVIRDISADCVAVGVPAKPLEKKNE